jgi:hypothetical protein
LGDFTFGLEISLKEWSRAHILTLKPHIECQS